MVVDEKRPDIDEACDRIPEVKRIIEFKVFERENVGLRNAFFFDSLLVGKAEVVSDQKREGSITQKEYTIPLLESLIELGGSAKTSMVLDRIYARMESRFKPVRAPMLNVFRSPDARAAPT